MQNRFFCGSQVARNLLKLRSTETGGVCVKRGLRNENADKQIVWWAKQWLCTCDLNILKFTQLSSAKQQRKTIKCYVFWRHKPRKVFFLRFFVRFLHILRPRRGMTRFKTARTWSHSSDSYHSHCTYILAVCLICLKYFLGVAIWLLKVPNKKVWTYSFHQLLWIMKIFLITSDLCNRIISDLVLLKIER